MSPISARLSALRSDIDAELRAVGRMPGSVRVLAVSKKQPVEAMLAAALAGVDGLGENYVQEAKEKFAAFDALRHARGERAVEKHFIGHLQTNKAKVAVQLFDVIQSIDRVEIAKAVAEAAARANKTLRVLVQVNISPTERFGATPEAARRIAEIVHESPHLKLDGVMAIGPITMLSTETAEAFSLAAKTFEALGGSTLSIGMSGDWREAVRAGSTMVRIGTALFGERPTGRT